MRGTRQRRDSGNIPEQAGGSDLEADLAVYEAVADLFGPKSLVFDCSERPVHLRAAMQHAGATVVLRLTRDVRSWVVSEQRRRRPGASTLRGRLARTTPALALRWYRHKRFLDEAVRLT